MSSVPVNPNMIVYPSGVHKGGGPVAIDCGHRRAQEPDGRQPARLLRARCERPRRSRAAEQRDELAAPRRRDHSITSSARASSIGGLSSPSVLIFAIGSRRMIVAAAGLCMTAFFHRSGGDLRRSCRIRSNHSNARRHDRRAMRNVILVT